MLPLLLYCSVHAYFLEQACNAGKTHGMSGVGIVAGIPSLVRPRRYHGRRSILTSMKLLISYLIPGGGVVGLCRPCLRLPRHLLPPPAPIPAPCHPPPQILANPRVHYHRSYHRNNNCIRIIYHHAFLRMYRYHKWLMCWWICGKRKDWISKKLPKQNKHNITQIKQQEIEWNMIDNYLT